MHLSRASASDDRRRGHTTRAPWPIVALVALVSTSRAAAADPAGKDACVAAVEEGQLARYHGRLRAARERFIVCARSVCPAPIQADCSQWLGEVTSSVPSVVFGAQWDDGRDALGVRVSIDGGALEALADGRAVLLDPGAHDVRFELAGATPVLAHVVVREGEKNRAIRATLAPLASTAPASHDELRPAHGGPVPAGAWVLGGVAALGIGGGVWGYVVGRRDLDALRASCGHDCSGTDVDAARRKLLLGDVSMGIGALAAGALTWVLLSRPAPPSVATASPPRFDLVAGSDGWRASLFVAF